MSDDNTAYLEAEVRRLNAEVENLREDLNDMSGTMARMEALLTRTANALKGPPPPMTAHSWHDLPELAAAAMANQKEKPTI